MSQHNRDNHTFSSLFSIIIFCFRNDYLVPYPLPDVHAAGSPSPGASDAAPPAHRHRPSVIPRTTDYEVGALANWVGAGGQPTTAITVNCYRNHAQIGLNWVPPPIVKDSARINTRHFITFFRKIDWMY